MADEEGMPLLDLKDLQALLVWIGENRAQLSLAIWECLDLRRLVRFNGVCWCWKIRVAPTCLANPRWTWPILMRTDANGQGMVNILASDKLMGSPRLYATFLLWLLSELFEELPEVGDPEKPKLVSFFDEAHLLFEDAPKVLVDKVEQVARLIRSKGVGVYFISQNPADIPEDILGSVGQPGPTRACELSQRAIAKTCGLQQKPIVKTLPSTPKQPSVRGWRWRGGNLNAAERRAFRA